VSAGERTIVGTVAVGGALGAAARYGLVTAIPPDAGRVPWAVLLVNVSGCLLIGVLMAAVTGPRPPHPLARPFLGIGVLGGYTTFSAYALDARSLAAGGHGGTALAYVLATALLALPAVRVGAVATERALAGRTPR